MSAPPLNASAKATMAEYLRGACSNISIGSVKAIGNTTRLAPDAKQTRLVFSIVLLERYLCIK